MADDHRTIARVAATAALALTVVAFGAKGATPATAAGRLYYAALGDSYSAGIGAGNEDGSACRRSGNAYPPQYGQISSRYHLTVFVACSGAVIADVQRGQIPAIAQERASLLTVTIGGNDARFQDIILDCERPRSGCYRDFPDEDRRIDGLVGPLHNLYTQIVNTVTSANLYVLTYPQIFRPGGTCDGTTGFFTADDIAWFRAEYSHMNRVIKQAAVGVARTHIADDENAFAGHEVCTARPWANGNNPGDPYSSFHPKLSGHAAMAATLRRVIGG
jgi:lysophospholipase L1-like esterase